MAGGVQERDGLAVDLHLICADVLGDAAGLTGGHMGVADIVQQTGLAVVHVTHDHHHRRPGHQILVLVLVVVDEALLNGDHHFLLHLAAHLLGDDGRGVKVDHLAQRGHNAVLHQALDHLCAGFLHAAGQLAHGDLIGDLHGDGRLFDDLQTQLAEPVSLFLLALAAGEAVVAALVIAEFLLALRGLLLPLAAAGAGVRHILQLLVVLVQIHVGGLAGIHHLLLGHAGHGLLHRLGGLLGGLTGGSRTLCGPVALLRRGGPGRLLALGRGRLLLRGLGALGEDDRDIGDRVVLGQILKDEAELPILQHLHVILGRFGVLGQDLRDLLGGDPEILGHLMHSVFVDDTTQIKPPPS